MLKQTPNICPACQGALHISELRCSACDTNVRGEFPLSPLGNLSEDHLDFIKTFILSRGNIKEVESQLGISYPTVRNKLDEVIKALSGQPLPQMTASEILDALESGKINASQAAELLESTKEGD
jgi:hypothetical protein